MCQQWIRVRPPCQPPMLLNIIKLIVSSCLLPVQSDLAMRLARRLPRPAEEFEQAVQLAEARYCAGGYRTEIPSLEDMIPGTYYLEEVDFRYRRIYKRVPGGPSPLPASPTTPTSYQSGMTI